MVQEEVHYLDVKRQMIAEPTDSEMLDWLSDNLSAKVALVIAKNGDLRASLKEMMTNEL